MTERAKIEIAGILFYRQPTGWVSEDRRLEILVWGRTFSAVADGKLIMDDRGEGGKRFRTIAGAMKAAINAERRDRE